jgi:MinD-like ATPase involved in chromosome partitioning or flagellar assembly
MTVPYPPAPPSWQGTPPAFGAPGTSQRSLRFIVAGSVGGAGATTIAALLAAALTARTGLPPRIVDHTGGSVPSRVATALPNAAHSIHDLGPHAAAVSGRVATPGVCPVIVATPDAEATETALRALRLITGAVANQPASPPGQAAGLRHCVVVVNTTSPKRPATPAATRLAKTAPGATVIPVEWDLVLARPGPIDPTAPNPATIEAIARIFQAFAV